MNNKKDIKHKDEHSGMLMYFIHKLFMLSFIGLNNVVQSKREIN